MSGVQERCDPFAGSFVARHALAQKGEGVMSTGKSAGCSEWRSVVRAILAFGLVASACLMLTACSSSPGAASRDSDDEPANEARKEKKARKISKLPAGTKEGFARLDELIARWDAAQSSGDVNEADVIKSQLMTESDTQFDALATAAEGANGRAAQLLAVSALGFSSRPEATKVVTSALGNNDPRIVGNALIALKLRADPTTPLGPLMKWIEPRAPTLPRRYAPLALANVMEARNKSGYPTEVAAERQALLRLNTVVEDRDPFVRLHAAKAFGALQNVSTHTQLKQLIQDETLRVRWAAAAAYERSGDIRGFPMVLRVLNDTPAKSKHIVRDVLVTYAGKLQGSPLSEGEVQAMGAAPHAWGRWFSSLKESKGIDPNSELGAELRGT